MASSSCRRKVIILLRRTNRKRYFFFTSERQPLRVEGHTHFYEDPFWGLKENWRGYKDPCDRKKWAAIPGQTSIQASPSNVTQVEMRSLADLVAVAALWSEKSDSYAGQQRHRHAAKRRQRTISAKPKTFYGHNLISLACIGLVLVASRSDFERSSDVRQKLQTTSDHFC